MLTGWSGQKFYVELASQSFNIVRWCQPAGPAVPWEGGRSGTSWLPRVADGLRWFECGVRGGGQIYTGAPIVLLGLLDQDVSAEEAQEFPLLYKDGPEGKRFNIAIFWCVHWSRCVRGPVCTVVDPKLHSSRQLVLPPPPAGRPPPSLLVLVLVL